MSSNDPKLQRTLEIILILITIALACLLYETGGHKITVLNLFYLPVVLAGFFLGRYRAGILALLCVVSASAIVVLDLNNFASFTSPVEAILAVIIWGAVLGLTALLVGTLNEERNTKATEAREAYVGVVEVLARYLQSANPNLQNRTTRILRLSEQVARKMRFSEKEIDDIRVAALLMDIENIEITSRVIKKAVGTLEETNDQHTIHGTELVQLLGSVLTGAFPLVLNQAEADEVGAEDIPFGARILRTVHAYDELVHNLWEGGSDKVQDALDDLQSDVDANHHPAVLHALGQVLLAQKSRTQPEDPSDAIEAVPAEV